MSDAQRDDDELRERLRRADRDFGDGRLQMLSETREAVFALRCRIWMQVRDAGCRAAALQHRSLRSDLGMMMRRDLRDRDNHEGNRGNEPPNRHCRVFCHELCKQTLYKSLKDSPQRNAEVARIAAVRSGLVIVLAVLLAISAISAFPLKSNCCCRAFCAMKMPHCSQRSCTIGRTELPRTATDASVVPLVVATESTALVVPAADKIFEAFREQHTLSVPSRPKTPPPRA